MTKILTTCNKCYLALKLAFPFIVALWAMFLISYITVKAMKPEFNIDVESVSFFGLIFTLVTIPIHNWFKNRDK